MNPRLRDNDPLLTTPLGEAKKPPPKPPLGPIPAEYRPVGLYKGPDGKWSYKPPIGWIMPNDMPMFNSDRKWTNP
jgi:hypothetical protein